MRFSELKLKPFFYYPVRTGSIEDENEARMLYHKRLISKEAMYLKDKYFYVESLLTETFTILPPLERYAATRSPRFSLINREACVIFESALKLSYRELEAKSDYYNIKSYASLVSDLKMEVFYINSFGLYEDFPNVREIKQPFFDADKFNNTPKIHSGWNWWRAYTDSKHEPSDIESEATLSEAIAALSAAFSILTRKYGLGLLSRFVDTPDRGITTYGNSKIFDIDEAKSIHYFFNEPEPEPVKHKV